MAHVRGLAVAAGFGRDNGQRATKTRRPRKVTCRRDRITWIRKKYKAGFVGFAWALRATAAANAHVPSGAMAPLLSAGRS